MNKEEALQELAKRELSRRHLLDFILYNFPNYQVNWHHWKICEALEKVERGEIKKLMITMPPRMGKSEICSIQFPAWYLGKHPDREIIAASYNADLAVEFGKKTRNLVRTALFGNVFKQVKLSEDSTAAGKWNTNSGGAYLAVGVGGGMTGRGADLLLIDDPVKDRAEAESEIVQKAVWDWYRSTARTRINPGGVQVLIQTRWTENDLAGRLLEDQGEQWTVLSFPAIAEEDEEFRKEGEPLWPELVVNGEVYGYSLEALQAIEKDVGPYDWSALFQQKPINAAAQEFKKEWYRNITQEEVSRMNTTNLLTVDTAMSKKSSADYTGFSDVAIDKDNFWYVKAWRQRLNPYELCEMLFALYIRRRYAKIGIEKTSYLEGLKPYLDAEQRKRGIFLPIVELTHGGIAKETRIRGLIPRYSSGSVFHIVGECVSLELEQATFPKGKHDDTLDSEAYVLQLDIPKISGVFIHRPAKTGFARGNFSRNF